MISATPGRTRGPSHHVATTDESTCCRLPKASCNSSHPLMPATRAMRQMNVINENTFPITIRDYITPHRHLSRRQIQYPCPKLQDKLSRNFVGERPLPVNQKTGIKLKTTNSRRPPSRVFAVKSRTSRSRRNRRTGRHVRRNGQIIPPLTLMICPVT